MATTVSLKEYFATAGSRFTKADAEVIGPQVEALAEQGHTTDRAIVDTARSANSPLNRFFEWDNDVAGDRFRLIQAGEMLRSIRVRVLENDRPRAMPVYKFVQKTAVPKPEPKGYNVLHEGSGFAARMATQAYDDLVAWRAKYASYLGVWFEFAATFRQVTNQIGEFEEAGRPGGLDRALDEAVAALVAWSNRFGGLTPQLEGVVEQARFMVEAIEAVGASVAAGGSGERSCMKCAIAFDSSGPENRLCSRCTRRGTAMAQTSS